MNDRNVARAEESSAEEIYRILKRDVTERLRNSCSSWPSTDFEALIEQVTRVAMKYPRTPRDRALVWGT